MIATSFYGHEFVAAVGRDNVFGTPVPSGKERRYGTGDIEKFWRFKIMKIYPAIDLKEGKCVRLIRGEAKSGRVYGDPIEWAKRWEAEGAQYLHVVDLDAAFTGEFVNKDVVKKIVTSVKIPVQLGGGVRTKDGVKQRLEEVGVSRVIIGTMAVEDMEFISWAKGEYGKDRIVVGIDAKNGKVLTRGWVKIRVRRNRAGGKGSGSGH